MGWKQGGVFGFDKPSDAVNFCSDKRGVIHAVARNGTELRHHMRGSKNPYPWEYEGRVIPGSFKGSGSIEIWADGNLQLIWPRTDGKNDAWWANPEDFSDPSEDPALPKYDENHVGWIGLLSWMMNNPNADLDGMFKKTSDSGVSCVRSFLWVGDPSASNLYHFHCLPWMLVEQYRVDFNLLNPLFEEQFKKLARYCKKYDMSFMPIFFMDRYNDHIFSLAGNVNGIDDKFSPEARPIVLSFVERCMIWLQEIGCLKYAQPMNEPAHWGNDKIAHQIADFHRDVGDKILEFLPHEGLIMDSSMSEYVHAWFVGTRNSDGSLHVCPHCLMPMGRDEFAERRIWSEQHSRSTIQGFLSSGFDIGLGSAWLHVASNEDGSPDGDKECPDIPSYRQGDTGEMMDSMYYALNESTKAGKPHIFSWFPFEALEHKDPPSSTPQENYDNWRKFDWDRIRTYSIVRRDFELGG